MFSKWINPISLIVGILGFGFAVYTYINCLPFRRLVFYADPASALIVKAGQSSKLAVTYDYQPINTDVVAAQIVLWNAGNLPIKPEHIRDAILIRTDPARPILEPTIRASTPERDKIINAHIDKTEAPLGRIKLTWDILEQDDGFQVQLIFAGPSETRLVPSGVLEGQKRIAIFSLQKEDWLGGLIIHGLIYLAGGLILFMLITLFFPWGRSKEIPPPAWFNLVMRAVLTVVVLLGICALLRVVFLHVTRPGLMPQSLITPALQQELQRQANRLRNP